MSKPIPTVAAIRIGASTFDPVRLELRGADGRPVALRAQAFRVLEHLVAHAGRVVSREELFAAVWPDVVVTDDSLVQCISDIRAALGDADRELIRTVPRRGYQLSLPATVEAVSAGDAQATEVARRIGSSSSATPSVDIAPAAPAAPSAATSASPGRWRTGRLTSLSMVGLIAALAIAAVLAFRQWAAVGTPDGPPAIAVLPFRGDVGTDPALGAGLAEDLAADLARNADLRVVSPRSSFPAAAQGGNAVSTAAQLRARYLVDGWVRAEAEALRLVVQLVDGTNGRIVWTTDSHLTAGSLRMSREALLQRMAGTLKASMAWDQKQSALASAPATLDSYTATLRALGLKHRMSPVATREARALLAPVLERDPTYAPAWAVQGYIDALDAGLGLTGERGPAQLGDAIATLRRAIALDPAQPLAWQGLAVALTWTERRAEALPAADRALQLAPGDADNRLFRALALLYLERYEEALNQVRAAQSLYPIVPPYVDGIVSLVLSANGIHEEALQTAQNCMATAPNFPTCRANRMFALAALGRLDEARADMLAMGGSNYLSTNQLVGRAGAERDRLLSLLSGAGPAAPVEGAAVRPAAPAAPRT